VFEHDIKSSKNKYMQSFKRNFPPCDEAPLKVLTAPLMRTAVERVINLMKTKFGTALILKNIADIYYIERI